MRFANSMHRRLVFRSADWAGFDFRGPPELIQCSILEYGLKHRSTQSEEPPCVRPICLVFQASKCKYIHMHTILYYSRQVYTDPTSGTCRWSTASLPIKFLSPHVTVSPHKVCCWAVPNTHSYKVTLTEEPRSSIQPQPEVCDARTSFSVGTVVEQITPCLSKVRGRWELCWAEMKGREQSDTKTQRIEA